MVALLRVGNATAAAADLAIEADDIAAAEVAAAAAAAKNDLIDTAGMEKGEKAKAANAAVAMNAIGTAETATTRKKAPAATTTAKVTVVMARI